MNCPNCGIELKENENLCSFCAAKSDEVANNEAHINAKYEEYKETEELKKRYGFNKLLIFSIIEFFCCFQLFGIIAVLLLFFKLKPAIEEKRFSDAQEMYRSIRLILIIGLVLGILGNLFCLGIEIFSAYVEYSSML